MIKKIKKKLNECIVLKLVDTKCYKILIFINDLFFHRNDLVRNIGKANGKNPDKTFYVIRSEDMTVGLMGLVDRVMNGILTAQAKGWIPIVDMKNYKTQYNLPNEPSMNAWEYYFRQVSDYTLEDVYNSRNVLIPGNNSNKVDPFTDKHLMNERAIFHEKELKKIGAFLQKNLILSEEAQRRFGQELKRVMPEYKLGVFIRGTDYIKLKPKGHAKQPNLEDVIHKVKEFLKDKPGIGIYLVTEDKTVYEKMKDEFGNQVVVTGDRFIDYKSGEMIVNDIVDKYEQGMEYLIRIEILAKCRYCIMTQTRGSCYAIALNGGKYEYKYIFDEGNYS